MIRHRSNRFFTAIFTLVFSLLLLVGANWYWSNQQNLQNLQELASEQLKTELMTNMREFTQRRTISLMRMPMIKDNFDRDDEYIRFRELGSKFLVARDKLFSLKLHTYEQKAWSKMRDIMNNGGRLQHRVIQLINDEGDLDSAITLTNDELIPNQDRFVRIISELLAQQRSLIDQKTQMAQRNTYFSYSLLGIMMVVTTLMIVFTVLMLRKSNDSDNALISQAENIRELYQVTSMTNDSLKLQFEHVLKLGCKLLRHEAACIEQYDLHHQQIERKFVYPQQNHLVEVAQLDGLNSSFSKFSFDANTPQQIVGNANIENANSARSKIQSLISAPIMINGQFFGSVNFLSQNYHLPKLLDIQKDLLLLMTGWIAVAFQRSNAHEQQQAAKHAAEEASRTKSSFLANMSHELRTPLNAIIGYGELLLEEKHDADSDTRDLNNIINSGKHLLELIDDILDLSKIEAGRIQLNPESTNIKALIDESCKIIAPGLSKNNNILTLDICDNNLEMLVDRTRMKQILLNLLSNANKFTHNGKITISVHRQNAQPAAGWGVDAIVFIIRDTGIGIPKEQLNNIFSAFHQVKSQQPINQQSGTGLGLTITRYFCEMMGGTIDASSEIGIGSTFTIKLPMESMQENINVA